MKKNLLILILLIPALFSCSQINDFEDNQEEFVEEKTHQVSQEFVQGSEDIPLLSEMEKVLESGLGFDTESGSIISSNYKTELNLETIKKFYIETLPQLGWILENSSIEKLNFRRENENLEIEFVNQDGENLVKFFISSGI